MAKVYDEYYGKKLRVRYAEKPPKEGTFRIIWTVFAVGNAH